jgi:hypothetical protein
MEGINFGWLVGCSKEYGALFSAVLSHVALHFMYNETTNTSVVHNEVNLACNNM